MCIKLRPFSSTKPQHKPSPNRRHYPELFQSSLDVPFDLIFSWLDPWVNLKAHGLQVKERITTKKSQGLKSPGQGTWSNEHAGREQMASFAMYVEQWFYLFLSIEPLWWADMPQWPLEGNHQLHICDSICELHLTSLPSEVTDPQRMPSLLAWNQSSHILKITPT